MSPQETLEFARTTLTTHFPGRNVDFLAAVFQRVESLFAGDYPGYQGCDTEFHDLAHTREATVALVRILDGHIKGGAKPTLNARDFELGVTAILLHDSGYFKQTGDHEGTGAKYTLTHVTRSAEFAANFLPPLDVSADEVRLVQLAIQCTGVNVDMTKLQFRNERERFLGCALGTGDILGQMAAPDYPERLPALYREYVEAAAFSKIREGGIAGYKSAEDLMRRTRGYYQNYVRRMLDTQWGGLHRVLTHHFADGKNHYFDAIENNLDRIDRMLEATRR